MKQKSNLGGRDVYVVDGSRTPFLKAKAGGPFSGSDLAVAAGIPLLNRLPISPTQLDLVVSIFTNIRPDEANVLNYCLTLRLW